MRNKIIVFVLWAAVAYTALVGGLYLAQRHLIYHPTRAAPVPAAYGLPDTVVRKVVTDDWITLQGWYWPPAREDAPVIIWFHGNAGDHALRAGSVRPYIDKGYGVLLAGYRGYAGHGGSPDEDGFYHDARAWLRFVREEDIAPQRIVLYGESLGTGVAVQMAVEHPELRALILQAPYTSLPDVAARQFFYVPVHRLMKDQFRSIDKIADVTLPLLVFMAMDDRIIPPALTQRVYEAARTNKKLIQYKDFGHNNMPVRERADAVDAFLED